MSSFSSSSSRRRFHVRRHPVVVDIGCSCRKPKLFSLLHNLSLSVRNNNSLTSASNKSSESTCSLTTTTCITNSTFSPCNDATTGSSSSSSTSTYASPKKKKQQQQQQKPAKKKKNYKKMAEESVAVEKVSSDPYLDFKDSMLQMIVEKEIYQWEELRELLNLFLSLNSPYHHHLILRAFAEIWEGLFSPAS